MLDFSRNTLCVLGRYVIPLCQYENGHLGFTVSRKVQSPTKNPVVIMGAEEMPSGLNPVDSGALQNELVIPLETLRKMHVHLAHLGAENMGRIIKAAGQKHDAVGLKAWIEECACKRQNVPIQRPIVARYIPDFCGHAISADVFIPLKRGNRGIRS